MAKHFQFGNVLRNRRVWGYGITAVVVYGFLLVAMAVGQRAFIYYPETAGEDRLLSRATSAGMVPWRDREGHLAGWVDQRVPVEPDTPRVLVFHGNAGHALYRSYYADALGRFPGTGWSVWVLEYPGYGARPGRPSETAILEAAREMMEAVLATSDGPIYLVGESLGSGVATRLAAEHPERVSGVLLITPFTTLAAVGQRHFPFLPVGALLRESYDNVTALAEYGGPVAIVVAEKDAVVPADLGQALYDGYTGPKRLWIQEGRDHNTLNLAAGSPWWREVMAFLADPD